MGKTTWIRSGLCLFAALALLCMGLALAESEAASPTVSLRIKGTDSVAELLKNESAEVEISAPGATAVKYMINDDYGEDLRAWGQWEEWSQNVDEWNICFSWDNWEEQAYVLACFDKEPGAENAVWVRSNTVDLNVTTYGQLAAHTIQHAGSLQRGELLELRLSGLDENADWTYVGVFNDEDTLFWQDHLGDVIYIPTAQLEPDTYKIGVGSRKVGYEDYWTEDAFTVTEPENGGIVFAIDKTEVVTFEEFTISVYAPGADQVKLFDGGWEIDCRDSDAYVQRHSHNEATELRFHAEAHMAESGEWISSETITVNVSAPGGNLEPIQVKLPGTLALEQPLNGTIMPVEGAQWYSLNIGYNRDGEWEWFENHDQEADNTTIDYDGHWFDEVGIYRLMVGAHAPGMSSSYVDAYLVVQPEGTEVVTLSVDGKTETLDNYIAQVQLPLIIHAPSGYEVEYFNGDHWNGISERSNGYTGSESFNGGVNFIVARARADENSDWTYSNAVTVHAEITGEVGALDLILGAEEVARGDELEVSFGPAENATQYGMYIRSEDGDFDAYIGGSEPGAYSLPTAMLKPGKYYVGVDYCGTGCDWRNVQQPFTVTEGVEPGDFTASLSANEVGCSKRVILSVYAPGAEEIRIYNENNPDEECFDQRDGDTYIQAHNWDHPDTLHFTASVRRDGEWGERVEIGELRVIECPQLARPEIKLSSSLIDEGEDVYVSFGEVENATQYWYELRDNDALGRDDYLMDGWYYVSPFVKLPASLFRAGHTYRLDVHVGAPGYETNDATYVFAVRPNATSATLTVNGESESVESWDSGNYHVVVEAPQGTTVIMVSDGYSWECESGERFERDIHYSTGDEVVLIARYTTDDINTEEDKWWENVNWGEVNWVGYSNPVTLRIRSNGYMPEVQAGVPASVIRGDFMKIAVTNAETFLNGGYENLWLHAEIHYPSEDTEEDRWYDCYDWDGEGTILLPTAELEVGRNYELHVRAGADGWVGSTHVYEFSVTEPEDGDIRFEIDKEQVVTGEDFTICVYAPGADQVKLFEGGWEIDCRDGAGYAQRHSHGEAGEYRFHAEAHMPETDAWVKTETIIVTVTAPGGSITADALGLTMPTWLNAGEPLTIRWNEFDLRHYDVNIERVRDGMRVWHSWNNHGETETTVPVVMPQEYDGMEPVLEPGTPVLEVGEFYRVNLCFQRVGFNNLYVEKQIVVVSDDMYAEGLTLMVDGNTDAYATLVNVDVPVKITAPQNATAILAWNGYGWEMYTGNEVVTNWSWGDVNERMLYARYTTDTIEDGKEWPEYGWSRVSNIVSVTTTCIGSMPDIDAVVPEEVIRGQFIEIAVNNPSDFQGYDGLSLTAEAHFRNEEEDCWYGRFDWDGEGTILLPTAELPDGRTFELHVRASAPGYTESESVHTFTVNPLPEGTTIYFDVSKKKVETCEQFTISVFAPGAYMVRTYGNHELIDESRGDYYVGDHWRSDVGGMVIFARAYYDDGENYWWEQTPMIPVTITATGKQLTADEVNFTVPSQLAPGDDLSVSWTDVGLDHYDLNVLRLSDGRDVWHSWNDHGETEMTVPVVMPDASHNMDQWLRPGEAVLAEGEAYEVTLSAYRQGSNALHVSKQVLVTAEGMFDENISLLLSKTDVLVNEEVTVTVEAPANATAILAWGGYDWQWYDGGHAEFTWSWGDANERMLYAKYTTDANADIDSDWNGYEWSGLSNIVTVHVTKLGNVEAPGVKLSSENPVRGDVLRFTVANADNGYSWTVYDTVDDWEWEWSDWRGNSTQEIDTYDLNGNRTYLLRVYKYGDAGYEGTHVEIPFTVTATGVAEAPDVEVEASVAQGDVLTIRIKNPDAGKLFRAWFWQEESGTNFVSDWNGVDTIYLPTHNLTAGVYTELTIQNNGSYGMEQSYTTLPIEVTEPSGKLSLCMEKTDLVTQEGTYIVAYAAGAQSIRLYACHVDEPDNPFWNDTIEGEVWQDWRNFTGRSGDKIVTAVATYPDGSTQEQTVHVTVTAPGGNLPKPVIDLPESVESGEDLNFSVTAKDAEWWFVEVFDHADEEGQPIYSCDVENYEESRSFTVLAGELVEGHTYSVNVYAARYGWNETYDSKEFTVVASDDPYAENVLRLPAKLGEIGFEAFEGVSARTVVIPNGTTTIGSRAFANCVSLKYVEIPDSVTTIAGDAFYGCNVTFICSAGSPAAKYAQANGIPVREKD